MEGRIARETTLGAPRERTHRQSDGRAPAEDGNQRTGVESTAPAGDTAAVDSVFGALADPTRRGLLDALAARGQASASALAADLPVSRQAIVKHLTTLEHAGLVEAERVGREVRYTPRPAPLEATARWLGVLAEEWDRRLHAIKRAAEEP